MLVRHYLLNHKEYFVTRISYNLFSSMKDIVLFLNSYALKALKFQTFFLNATKPLERSNMSRP